MTKYNYISFISDMGVTDESVAVCKSIMLQQAPGVNIIDVTHEVVQFDVRAAALMLVRSLTFLPPGVIVVAVDPGAPKNQRFIAVETPQGVLIGPDNGVLAPAVSMIHAVGAETGVQQEVRVHEISNVEFRLDVPLTVFAARDILAPAAGVVASGTDIAELGPAIALEQLVPAFINEPKFDQGGAIYSEAWTIDRFGNVELNLTTDDLAQSNITYGATIKVQVSGQEYMALLVETFADLSTGQLGILPNSAGGLSLVKNMASAAEELNLKPGREVVVIPPGASATGQISTVADMVGTPDQIQQSQHSQAGVVNPLAGAPTQQGNEFVQVPVQQPQTAPGFAQPVQAEPQPYVQQPQVQPENPFGAPAQPVPPAQPANPFGQSSDSDEGEKSLGDILNSSSMPSTFSKDAQQPQVQPENPFGAQVQPVPPAQPAQAAPANPFEGTIAPQTQNEQEGQNDQSGASPFSGNVFDLFKSESEENENNK